MQQRIAVEHLQVGLAVDVRGPALPRLFHRQVRAADRGQPVHGVDDTRQVRRARPVVRVPDAVDVLEGQHVPARGLIVPQQPRRDRVHVWVDHRLAALPDHPGMIDAKPLNEHPACVGIQNYSEL
jgi:hypothetical protein